MAALVDDADGARAVVGQVRHYGGDVLLENVAGLLVIPTVLGEEQLQGADARAGSQGNGLGRFPLQLRQEPPAIDAEVAKRLRVFATEQVGVEVVCQGGGQVKDLLFGHGQASGGASPGLGNQQIPGQSTHCAVVLTSTAPPSI